MDFPHPLPLRSAERFRLLRTAGVGTGAFAISLGLSVLQVFLGAAVWALLLPLLKGLFENDFTVVARVPLLKSLVSLFPVLAATSTNAFLFLVGCAFLLSAAKGFLAYFATLLLNRQAREVDLRIRELVFRRSLEFGNLFFTRNRTGKLVTAMESCVRSFNEELNGLRQLLVRTATSAALLAMLFYLSWRTALAVVVCYPVLYGLTRGFVRRARKLAVEQSDAAVESKSRFLDVLAGINVIKAFGTEAAEHARFASLLRREAALASRLDRVSRLMDPIHELGGLAIQIGIAVAFNHLGGTGSPTPPHETVLFLFLLTRLSPELKGIDEYLHRMARNRGARAQFEWLEQTADKAIVPSGGRPCEGLGEGIEIRRLTFAYETGRPVLRDLSLRIPAGRITALVGPSGAGKSTLCQLMLRLLECPPGTIFLGGVDIRELDIGSLKRRTALVGQETFLFDDTIRANLFYGAPGPVPESRLARAVRAAQLEELVARLPRGLDTRVGEKGATLSGGERQRLSIARALLREPDLLIMDEPTNALDIPTETRLLDDVADWIAGRTVVLISHRPSTIRLADHIVCLQAGTVRRQGPADDMWAWMKDRLPAATIRMAMAST